MKFNLGKFNVATDVISIRGQSVLELQSEIQIEVERRADGGALLALNSNRSNQTVEKYGSATVILIMESFNDPTRIKYAPGVEETAMQVWTSGITNLLGVDSIHLVVNLQPGDTLELDMCEMTALLNNENAMKYLASDGDFFDFPAGKNDIVVDVTPANVPIESEVYYKDRWL